MHPREALDAQAQAPHDPHAVVGQAGVEEVGEGRVLQPARDRVQAHAARRRDVAQPGPRSIGEDAALGRACDELGQLHRPDPSEAHPAPGPSSRRRRAGQQGPGADDLAAGVVHAVGERAVGGHHAQRAGLGVARDERGDVVVGGVAPRARRSGPHPHAAAGVVGAAVEDDRHRLVARRGERLQALDQPPLRAAPDRATTVGPPADDVVAVDDPLGHGPSRGFGGGAPREVRVRGSPSSVQDMTGLARAVRTVVRRCLAVAPGEDVLVIVDEPLQDVGEALRREAQDAQADAVLAVMSARENHGAEPPPPIAAAFAACDVFIAPDLALALAHARAQGARPTTARAARRCPTSPRTCSRG